MNDDELECFRKAAALGCPDFRWNENIGLPEFDILESWQALPMDGEERVNRYAAAVCECWWRNVIEAGSPESASKVVTLPKAMAMIDLCREFGRKYGAAQ